jgi:uncharacterized protein YecE (DUF72 family)
MAIRVGCGSWADQEYVGLLYPRGLPPAQRLHEYAKWFNHVEVNSSYYATPRREVVRNWIRQTPADFLFDLKLHRHLLSSLAKKPGKGDGAKSRPDLLAFLLEQVQPLIKAKKLGAFLLLLPPRFGPEKNRLEELDVLVEKIKPHRFAVEFRNNAWVKGRQRTATLDYFRARGISWVCVDMPKLNDPTLMPPMDEVTQPGLAYLRLHGRNKLYLEAKTAEERHDYLYTQRDLKEIVARVRRLSEKAAEVRVVANNHAGDFAPRTAIELRRLLGQPVPGPLASPKGEP